MLRHTRRGSRAAFPPSYTSRSAAQAGRRAPRRAGSARLGPLAHRPARTLLLARRWRHLAAGASLPALDLSSRGELAAVHVHSFAAGRVAAGAELRMAQAAEADLRVGLRALGCGGVPVELHAAREGPERARGDGSGVLLVAHTSTGCR